MISIAVLITIAVVITRKNIFYGMVVIWALFGIIQKRLNVTVGSNGQIPDKTIINVALAGIVIVTITGLVQLIRNNRAAKIELTDLKSHFMSILSNRANS